LTDGEAWFAAFDYRSSWAPPAEVDPFKWTVYDEHVFSSSEVEAMPFRGWVQSVALAPSGVLWIAYSSGVASFDPSREEWRQYNLPEQDGASAAEPQDLAIAPDGSLWITSGYFQSAAALHLTPAAGANGQDMWRVYGTRDGIPQESIIQSVTVAHDGAVWFDVGLVARCIIVGGEP
jgi:streptogramin lyase